MLLSSGSGQVRVVVLDNGAKRWPCIKKGLKRRELLGRKGT